MQGYAKLAFLVGRTSTLFALLAQRRFTSRRLCNWGFERHHRAMSASFPQAPSNDEVNIVLAIAEQAARAAGKLIKDGRGAIVRELKANPRDLLTEVDGAAQDVIERKVAAAFPSHGFLGEESVGAGPAASAAALDVALSRQGWLWIVDPIDGTTNFASGLTLSAVSIGVSFCGELQVGVIYDPFMDEMFAATRGRGATVNGAPMACKQNSASLDADAVLGEAVVFAGSPPATNSMIPTLRGVTALMPRVRTVRMVGSAALMLAWVADGRASAYFEPDLNAWDTSAGALLIHEAGGQVVDLDTLDPYSLVTRRILATNGDPRLISALHKHLKDAHATILDSSDQL